VTAYQWRLMAFLSVATFFEGFDIFALAQLLPTLQREWNLGELGAGALIAFTNVGTIAAFGLIRLADRWGRKQVLSVTILGYAAFTLLTAVSVGPVTFACAQFVARIFLIAEWATASVVAAEEFPAGKRGLVIGVVQATSSFGAIACAGLVPVLLHTALGWRSVFVVGVAPLLAMAVARRGLRETGRFAAKGGGERTPLLRILGGPYRDRVLQLALIWGLTYVCTQAAITFWKEFAIHERGWTEGQVGGAMTIAAVAALPGIFATGKLLDLAGRKMGGAVIVAALAAGVVGAYTLWSPVALVACLTLGMYGTSAILPVLNAYTTERFPTELRGDAFAWANNLLGRLAYVGSPLAVGAIAGHTGWGPAVAVTAVGPVLAIALIWAWLPETAGRELEATAAL
jgi:putative MFS transporter